MAESKRKHAPKSPQVFDVSRPGKSAPSHTAKPVIVSNRPVLRDPMVTATPDTSSDDDEAPAAQPISHTGKIVIKPLDENLTAEAESKTKEKPEETEAEQTAPKLPPMPVLPVEEKEPAAAKEESPQAEPPEEKEEKPGPSDDEPVAPEAKEAEKTEPEPEKQPETAKDEGKTDEPDSTEPETPAKGTGGKKSATETTEEAAAAKAAHDAEIQKLVEGREYYLPINAVEKRRAKRFVALGIILAIILALAWIDIALDAGLIHLGGLKAVTHFFSS